MKPSILPSVAVACLGLVILQSQAMAQQVATAAKVTPEAGRILEIQGPVGAVIVVRSSQAYALQAGDLLFEGDRIVTRSNGQARLVAGGCEKTLEPSASIVINGTFCEEAATLLTGGEAVLGLQLATASAPVAAGASATPAYFGILTGTAAAASSNDSPQASPID